jgi:large subunit ribosomal protein L10
VNREEKAAVVTALHERLTNASVTLVTTNLGMTVEQSNALRRTLRAVGGEYKVAKHTLVRLALSDTRFAKLDAFLEGPRSLVFGYSDPVRVTKTLVDFAENNNKLQIDGGALEGQLLPAEQVKALAKMPPIESLRARIVRQATLPGSRVVSSATAPARRLAGAVAALVKKLEGSDAPS